METKTTGIVQGNKLIAEFDGRKRTTVNGLAYWSDTEKLDIFQCLENDLKYHSSWDWLMPSWSKLVPLILAENRFDIIEEFKDAVVKNSINEAWAIVVKGIDIVNSPYS